MKKLICACVLFISIQLFSQEYPFFAIANGNVIQSEKPGKIVFSDSLISIYVDNDSKPTQFKVSSHQDNVYTYNSGSFTILKQSGKVKEVGAANGKKYTHLINMTMPNGLGGTLTLKYVCYIKD